MQINAESRIADMLAMACAINSKKTALSPIFSSTLEYGHQCWRSEVLKSVFCLKKSGNCLPSSSLKGEAKLNGKWKWKKKCCLLNRHGISKSIDRFLFNYNNWSPVLCAPIWFHIFRAINLRVRVFFKWLVGWFLVLFVLFFFAFVWRFYHRPNTTCAHRTISSIAPCV